jgi:hypothetical protein
VNINGYHIEPGILREWGKRLISEMEWFYFKKSIPGMDMFSLSIRLFCSSVRYQNVICDLVIKQRNEILHKDDSANILQSSHFSSN